MSGLMGLPADILVIVLGVHGRAWELHGVSRGFRTLLESNLSIVRSHLKQICIQSAFDALPPRQRSCICRLLRVYCPQFPTPRKTTRIKKHEHVEFSSGESSEDDWHDFDGMDDDCGWCDDPCSSSDSDTDSCCASDRGMADARGAALAARAGGDSQPPQQVIHSSDMESDDIEEVVPPQGPMGMLKTDDPTWEELEDWLDSNTQAQFDDDNRPLMLKAKYNLAMYERFMRERKAKEDEDKGNERLMKLMKGQFDKMRRQSGNFGELAEGKSARKRGRSVKAISNWELTDGMLKVSPVFVRYFDIVSYRSVPTRYMDNVSYRTVCDIYLNIVSYRTMCDRYLDIVSYSTV